MVIFDFKEEGTGTEHVAIATSKCVPSGIFVLGCNISAKFQQHWFTIGGDILKFVSHPRTRTTDDVISG